MQIGLLHPGEMGVSIGLALVESGHTVLWCAAQRSFATQERAESFNKCESLEVLVRESTGIVSVCPPAAALTQAEEINAFDFGGVYIDANAVAPSTAMKIQNLFGDNYVDGGIIGPPALRPDTTRIYLSGVQCERIADWFTAGSLQAIALGPGVTAASALKMAYAAYTKGSSALLLAVNALADQCGVRAHLLKEWDISQPGLSQRSERAALGTSRKAWRFVGEMQEIASTFEAQSLPGDFHYGAAEIYQRMASLKDHPPSDIDKVLSNINNSSNKETPV